MNQNIYRKEALARLASPEQLDQLMPLTNPRGWIALGTAALLLLAALAWMIFGTISVNVEGQGVLLRPGGLHQMTASEAGVVSDIAVHPGDEARPMQELLRLAPAIGENQPDSVGPSLRDGQRVSEKPAYTTVVSSVLGRILEVSVQPGEAVEKGASLVTVEALDQPLEAVVYLAAADGYRVERGMDVEIRPVATGSASTAIPGRVRSAARYPASPSHMLRTLKSEDLVSALTKFGPRLEVVIEVLPSAKTRLDRLFSGTPCRAQITLHRHSPIHLLQPAPKNGQEL